MNFNKNDFILQEMASSDTIDVKRIYMDMAENMVAGILLSQIVFWHLPNRKGEPKLKVKRNDELWIAKSWTDWWKEIRISKEQYRYAIKLLQDKQLVITKVFKFKKTRMVHIRLNWTVFLSIYMNELTAAIVVDEETGEETVELNRLPKAQLGSYKKGKTSLKSENVKNNTALKLQLKDETLQESVENNSNLENIEGKKCTFDKGTKLLNYHFGEEPNCQINNLVDDQSVNLTTSLYTETTKKYRDNAACAAGKEEEIIIMPSAPTSANASVVSEAAMVPTKVRSCLELRGEAEKEKTKNTHSTPESTNHLDGLFDLNSTCIDKFGENAFFVLNVLRGVKGSSDDDILTFVNTVFKEFSSDVVYRALSDVEKRIKIGQVREYNLTYIYNSILHNDTTESGFEENSMKANVAGKFRRFCREHFHNDELGDSVYEFYKNKLTDTGNDDNKIKNIEFICKNYGEQYLFKAMRSFIKNIESGVYSTKNAKSMSHFLNYISKAATTIHSKPLESTVIPNVNSEGERWVIPVAIERVDHTFSGMDEWYGWSYRCSCGESLRLLIKNCSKCKNKIDWSMVVYKGVKYGHRASTAMMTHAET